MAQLASSPSLSCSISIEDVPSREEVEMYLDSGLMIVVPGNDRLGDPSHVPEQTHIICPEVLVAGEELERRRLKQDNL